MAKNRLLLLICVICFFLISCASIVNDSLISSQSESEEILAEEIIVEAKAIEETKTKGTLSEEQTIAESSAEEIRIEGTLSEEQTIAESSAEEIRIEGTLSEEQTIAESSAEEIRIEGTLSKEQTIAESSAEEIRIEGALSKEQTIAEFPAAEIRIEATKTEGTLSEEMELKELDISFFNFDHRNDDDIIESESVFALTNQDESVYLQATCIEAAKTYEPEPNVNLPLEPIIQHDNQFKIEGSHKILKSRMIRFVLFFTVILVVIFILYFAKKQKKRDNIIFEYTDNNSLGEEKIKQATESINKLFKEDVLSSMDEIINEIPSESNKTDKILEEMKNVLDSK